MTAASAKLLDQPSDLSLWVGEVKQLIEQTELARAQRIVDAFRICHPTEVWPHILKAWLAVESQAPRTAMAECDLVVESPLFPRLSEGEKEFIQALRSRSETALRTQEAPPREEPSHPAESAAQPEVTANESTVEILARKPISVKKLAFYLPQFHPIPENDEWWGEGFTEWNNVSRAKPFFPGHWQPRRPGPMGFYDLRVPATMNKQFELARRYGLDGFCFYYYWFNGRKLLEKPLEMLMAGETDQFPFCICWVNETWTRSWDGMSGEVLIEANQSLQGTKAFIRDIEPILKHNQYIRVDGKPVVLVYCPQKLEDPLATVQDWREFARASGIGELHLCAVQSFAFDDPFPLGFDAAVEFPPHCVWNKHEGLTYCRDHTDEEKEALGADPDFKGVLRDYRFFAECAMKRPQEPYLLYRSCMLAWDNTARRMENGHVYVNFTTDLYTEWLATIIDKAYRDPKDSNSESLVFINAWNEWAEGCTLEPDQHFGHALLRATQRATVQAEWMEPYTSYKNGLPVGVTVESDHYNLIVFGHDAHPFGAQINLLSMVRNLTKKMKSKVHVVLLEGGPLADSYRRVATTTILSEDLQGSHQQLEQLIAGLKARGYDRAILNTTVCGRYTGFLKAQGVRVTNLIHELPSLIQSYQLEEALYELADKSDDVVFSTEYVRKKVKSEFSLALNNSRVLPQGINFNPEYGKKQQVREKLRAELSIPEQGLVLMGCGHGDFRKGIDIFVRLAMQLVERDPTTHLIWAGRIDPGIESYVRGDIENLGLSKNIILTGEIKQPFEYYLASDIFLLTSREDPLPSVVMEAFDAGLPVVGFKGAGGFCELFDDERKGRLVPYLDEQAMLSVVLELKDQLSSGINFEANHAYARQEFDYVRYLNNLLRGEVQSSSTSVISEVNEPLSVTAIVPNYNYKRYLGGRLKSIARQTYPVKEIIFLDDCSSDGSLDYATNFARECPIPFRIIANKENSGNVSAQWKMGIDLARSDYAWIAEADDYAEPTMIEELISIAAKYNEFSPSICYCESWMTDSEGVPGGTYLEYHLQTEEICGSIFRNDLLLGGLDFIVNGLGITNVIPNASACILKLQALQAVSWHNALTFRLSGDWWIYANLAIQGSVAFSPKALNYHRRHPSSVVNHNLSRPIELAEEAIRIHQEIYSMISEDPRSGSVAERNKAWRLRMFPQSS
ncbi:glycoside hydrolase family 99-like domain-containing protein [Synechococcus sp. L2F]|uniref:glycoside hydrolase family 99-like domain-containing protein n=1 Tax=Synechococcus sp. L2F TaxID=2823739 RepID=UPI0020CDAB13|nr:glycoside hydrolase family 99-like domain-containing protein [Synechococcus sp. L2F]MCP9827922.1 glycoside hydrolase family 99-like domain-containing protein [Synechococcus sp. L2F]